MLFVKTSAILLAIFAFLMVFSSVSFSQNFVGEWLLGVWKGAHSHPTEIRSDEARFEFVQDGGQIKWKMSRVTEFARFGRGESTASGVVTKISANEVELDGKYDSPARTKGYPLKYSLTRISEDKMEGYALGRQNVSFPVSLQKVK